MAIMGNVFNVRNTWKRTTRRKRKDKKDVQRCTKMYTDVERCRKM